MHIGLFFGSFNPVHVGHMILANYFIEFTDIEKVWFVVSPHNPLKDKTTLLRQDHRLMLVDAAIDDYPHFKASNIEFSLPQPSYTINTLARLSELYPGDRFSLIMGQDNLQSFNKWRNYEEILRNHLIYVYPRKDSKTSEFDSNPQIKFTDAPLVEVSASFIRKAIKERKDVRHFLPHKVWEEIDLMNFYRK